MRREEILKRKGLVSSGPGRKNSENSSQLAYARQASETLGISKRTVEKDLARGKKIAPEVLAEITGTALDKGVVLDEPRPGEKSRPGRRRENLWRQGQRHEPSLAVARDIANGAVGAGLGYCE
jgi:hypothetical protein